VSALLASLSKRLCKYEEDDVYTTSSILDTRFKLLWSKPEDVDDLTTDLKKKFSFIEHRKAVFAFCLEICISIFNICWNVKMI
jgi:hypothetical protein